MSWYHHTSRHGPPFDVGEDVRVGVVGAVCPVEREGVSEATRHVHRPRLTRLRRLPLQHYASARDYRLPDVDDGRIVSTRPTRSPAISADRRPGVRREADEQRPLGVVTLGAGAVRGADLDRLRDGLHPVRRQRDDSSWSACGSSMRAAALRVRRPSSTA